MNRSNNSTSRISYGNDSNNYNKKLCNIPIDGRKSIEVNRIPSINKKKFCVSTIGTQADMDKGSIIAERKDVKYRNQEWSDVESQILSIELDVCSETYGNIGDWCTTNLPNTNTNRNDLIKANKNPIATVSNSITYNDIFISARKELASVRVNDYVAFKNCLNSEFENKALSEEKNKIAGVIKNNLDSEILNPAALSPQKNQRMMFRISSVSSSRSSNNKRNNKSYESFESILQSDQVSSDLMPFTSYNSNNYTDELKTKRQPFFSLNSDSENYFMPSFNQTKDFKDKQFPNNIQELYTTSSILTDQSNMFNLINPNDYDFEKTLYKNQRLGDIGDSNQNSSIINENRDSVKSSSKNYYENIFLNEYKNRTSNTDTALNLQQSSNSSFSSTESLNGDPRTQKINDLLVLTEESDLDVDYINDTEEQNKTKESSETTSSTVNSTPSTNHIDTKTRRKRSRNGSILDQSSESDNSFSNKLLSKSDESQITVICNHRIKSGHNAMKAELINDTMIDNLQSIKNVRFSEDISYI